MFYYFELQRRGLLLFFRGSNTLFVDAYDIYSLTFYIINQIFYYKKLAITYFL